MCSAAFEKFYAPPPVGDVVIESTHREDPVGKVQSVGQGVRRCVQYLLRKTCFVHMLATGRCQRVTKEKAMHRGCFNAITQRIAGLQCAR